MATAYGPATAACKVGSWYPSGTTEQVSVRCFNAGGLPADSMFTTTFAQPQSTAHPLAYLWANSPTASSYTPNSTYQFNSSGAANTITRLGVGYYAVQLPNLGASAGHVQVTAYGYGSERCKVAGWGPSGTAEQVYVRCFTSAGALVDTMYTMTYANGTSLDGGPATSSAYAWASNPTSPSYTPSLPYQFNSSGAANTITRLNTGSYAVNLPNQNLGTGDIQVTAYGMGPESCQVQYWTQSSGAVVNCVNSSGTSADTYFDLAYLNA